MHYGKTHIMIQSFKHFINSVSLSRKQSTFDKSTQSNISPQIQTKEINNLGLQDHDFQQLKESVKLKTNIPKNIEQRIINWRPSSTQKKEKYQEISEFLRCLHDIVAPKETAFRGFYAPFTNRVLSKLIQNEDLPKEYFKVKDLMKPDDIPLFSTRAVHILLDIHNQNKSIYSESPLLQLRLIGGLKTIFSNEFRSKHKGKVVPILLQDDTRFFPDKNGRADEKYPFHSMALVAIYTQNSDGKINIK